MNKTLESEIINEVFASMSPERRAAIEKRAGELAESKDFRQAAKILEKSDSLSLDETKFAGELGWLAALSVAIASVAASVMT
ncbi:MAG: hypothetical protein WCE58_00495 [Gallionella sp.]